MIRPEHDALAEVIRTKGAELAKRRVTEASWSVGITDREAELAVLIEALTVIDDQRYAVIEGLKGGAAVLDRWTGAGIDTFDHIGHAERFAGERNEANAAACGTDIETELAGDAPAGV